MDTSDLNKKYWAEQWFRNIVDGFVAYMVEHEVMANDILDAIDGKGENTKLIKDMANIRVDKKDIKDAVYLAFDDVCKNITVLKAHIDDMNNSH
jgi:hypothetical protein